jgi:hypothetical protein
MLAANRSALNQNQDKPFMILINGRGTTVNGHLEEYLDGNYPAK